ncbi:tyrosine-type recombinase/integrase [Bacillus stercoris]|nr:tyrosine-type recombinase/integrase [Bacillus stercoris]WIL37067.1 tyrosine-type recombinase/integrase [Bacillus stercoris]
MNAARTLKYHHYIIALTLLRTGLRKGELIALYWSDVNLEKKTITAQNQKMSTVLNHLKLRQVSEQLLLITL